MSASVCDQNETRDIELGTGVSWPLVYAALGLGGLVTAAVIFLGVLAATRAAPENDLAVAHHGAAPARASQPKPNEPPLLSRPTAPAVSGETADSEPWQPPAVVLDKPAPQAPPPVVALRPATQPAPPYVPLNETLPAPAIDRPEEYKSAARGFQRRSPYNEDELLRKLAYEAREIDLDTEKGTTAKLLIEGKDRAKTEWAAADKDGPRPPAPVEPILELVAQRADLKGLPVRNGTECQLEAKEARALQEISRAVRALNARASRSGDSTMSQSESKYRDIQLLRLLDGPGSKDDTAARALAQMIQTESPDVRLSFVKKLPANKGKSATAALARQAIFDVVPEIREAAAKALKARPGSEYRPVLLEALRYPWAPAADHAAEALVELDDQEAVLPLVLLLDLTDPRAPTLDKEKNWTAPEMVRVNHLSNCLLCHAQSSSKKDLVRAPVPVKGEPLPVVYYDKTSGDTVRADVTYLKQDFSVMQAVTDSGKWPEIQRFDYLIRNRKLSAEEATKVAAIKDPATGNPFPYPQREAVLWALRELTGEDFGDQSEEWFEFAANRFLPKSP